MTDAHCHLPGDAARHFVCSPACVAGPSHAPERRVFYGVHPWEAGSFDETRALALRHALAADPWGGVGEIGLDRLRTRTIPDAMREAFRAQLEIAADFSRPVTLHGAKCWGEVVAACRPFAGRVPAFVFHGFSRSFGLLKDIIALNGFISIGPAILNAHAVNYREDVRRIPEDRLLVETDRTADTAARVPPLADIVAALAALRGVPADVLDARLDANASRV